jgi:hypothetical protein
MTSRPPGGLSLSRPICRRLASAGIAARQLQATMSPCNPAALGDPGRLVKSAEMGLSESGVHLGFRRLAYC